jgi:hypothetical protein
MCWNAEVSLQSFFLGVMALGVGWATGLSIPVLFFCLTIVLMQLVEFVVWKNYDDKHVNRSASYAAAALLTLQPVASILTLTSNTSRLALLFGYAVAGGLGQLFDHPRDYSMTVSPTNGHLAWNWLDKTPASFLNLAIYFFFLFIPLILTRKWELLGLAVITLAASLFSFWQSNTWGSLWCWLVNIIVLFVAGKQLLVTSHGKNEVR